ncbi:palmitoyltransferase swf1 [Didymella sp. IMI 355093]|nr:palmitoyltransferase swf1 [Didymella sp. IMI 355093]
MALARTLILLALTVSFFTFVAFFGRLPALRNTPIGFLNRLFVLHIPSLLRRLDVKLTNGRITSSSSALAHHLMHDKHPVIVVFFLGLVTACASLLLPAIWSSLGAAHKMLVLILLPQPYVWLYLSAKSNRTTYITPHNHAEQMRHYPYDRVARQYTRYEEWYRYKPAPGSDSASWTYWLGAKGHYFAIYLSLYLDLGGLSTAGVGLLALLTWPLPLGLLAYHIYLIWAGMTTNESSKWADWRDDMADGVVFLGGRREDSMAGHEFSGSNPTAAPIREPTGDESGSESDEPILTPGEDEEDVDVEEPPTSWPLESRHILVRTRDGQPPKSLPARVRRVAEADSFERVWSLAAVENVYDLGFWDNLVEALSN